jgi:hypothetical protein
MSEEKREQKNNRLLIIGVSIFTVLFLFLWLFNVQRLIFSSGEQVNNENEEQVWENIQEEFSQGFIEMNQVWEEAQRNQIITDSEVFMENLKTTVEKEVTKIENNNDNLQELPQAEEVKEDIIESTNYCPEFVNCMPSYGEIPEDFCLVPPGCEDITLKVY